MNDITPVLKNLYPVIIAGGHGTRLWPLSREKFPKQFQKLINEESLLQATLTRLGLQFLETHEAILLCNQEHRFLVAEQLQQIQAKAAILLEPVVRNTAPAIALGALHLLAKNPQAMMLVMPADHWISDTQQFMQAVEKACVLAANGDIVTFGMTPDSPQTGYGYIEMGAGAGEGVFQLHQFIEKPTLEKAQEYLNTGNYLWNAGIFCLSAKTYLDLLERYQPAIIQAAKTAYENARIDQDFIRIDEAAFAQAPAISIDYAIMEKMGVDAPNAKVIPVNMGWTDIGSWSALWQTKAKDKDNNVLEGDVLAHDSTHCYVRSENRLVSLVGMANCVVVETSDAVLIADKSKIQDIKVVVEKLKSEPRSEVSEHRLVRRPWGCYEAIDSSARFQVKRITVNPGASLSLQMHYHRAEHWIVVKGTAQITCGDNIFTLHENESTFIPIGTKHRLKNPGMIPLEIIEVQSGSYLGEDDIVRFEDDYQRETIQKRIG